MNLKSHQEHKSGYTNDYTILPGSRFGERNVKIMIYDLYYFKMNPDHIKNTNQVIPMISQFTF